MRAATIEVCNLPNCYRVPQRRRRG